jgi:hypothetical protein
MEKKFAAGDGARGAEGQEGGGTHRSSLVRVTSSSRPASRPKCPRCWH